MDAQRFVVNIVRCQLSCLYCISGWRLGIGIREDINSPLLCVGAFL